MERKSFVFYESWLEAIKNLPRDIQGEVLTAIVEYGLYGETTESLKPIAKAMLTMVIPQIEANNKKYKNGQKGGRPPKEGNQPQQKAEQNQTETNPKPKPNQDQTNEKPSHNQTETKTQPNVICNNGICNNDNDKKESANADKKEGEPKGSTPAPEPDEDYKKFQDWMKRKAPFCNDPKNFPHQITEEELLKLKEKYTGEQLANIIEQIENRRDLRKRYTNLYRTVPSGYADAGFYSFVR